MQDTAATDHPTCISNAIKEFTLAQKDGKDSQNYHSAKIKSIIS